MRDVLSWRFIKNVIYTARFGYVDAFESEILTATRTGDATHWKDIWSPITVSFSSGSMEEWICHNMNRFDEETFYLFAIVLWTLWFN